MHAKHDKILVMQIVRCKFNTVKPVLSGQSKKEQKIVFNTNNCLMQAKALQNAPREHSAIHSTFIKLPFAFKTLVLSIFEWPLKTGFFCI